MRTRQKIAYLPPRTKHIRLESHLIMTSGDLDENTDETPEFYGEGGGKQADGSFETDPTPPKSPWD